MTKVTCEENQMSGKKWSGLLVGAVVVLALTGCGKKEEQAPAPKAGASTEQLTILWAQWDPANYLQELVKDYEKQTGVKVTVETTPWPDFQTKAFREFAARGDAYDMVVGDSQWLGAGSTVVSYAEYPKGSQKYWAIPLEGDATGWSYRKDWFEDPKEMAAFKKKYGYDLGVPKTWANMRDIAEFFHRPNEKRYGVAIYTDNSYDALVMGYENVLFGYGGELGDYGTYQVKGIINSKTAVDALSFYKALYQFTPPGWGKVFFMENNQAITEGLAAMSMNYFAFFPALTNPATNKHADVTGYFANPEGPTGKRFAALGGQGISIISYSKKQAESEKFLEWFIRDDVQEKWAELGGYTCNAKVLQSDKFRKATPYNEAFYQTMFMVKDFWAVPEYAELLDSMNKRLHPYVVGNKGTAKEALDGVANDWDATFRKYERIK
jgi:multiple sugar transport system substrate-binding protein